MLAQGNQAGAGAELANILKEIAAGESGMVIEGTYDGTNFSPSSSVSIETAANFIKSGGKVICHYIDPGATECWAIITNVEYADGFTYLKGNIFEWNNA